MPNDVVIGVNVLSCFVAILFMTFVDCSVKEESGYDEWRCFVIKQIVSANDWFFVGPTHDDKGKIVFPLAAWALHEDGAVVGMISVPHASLATTEKASTPASVQCRLVGAPPIGMYKHLNELTESDLAAAFSGTISKEVPNKEESFSASHAHEEI
ncbi:hypothetical protein HF282_03825 [Acidithiobacillus ferrooxidans]|nr:hypothetical protein [Acidithiobacillus ferrooxidans]